MAITPSEQLARGMVGGAENEAWKELGGADGIRKLIDERLATGRKVSAAFREKNVDRLFVVKGEPVKGEAVK